MEEWFIFFGSIAIAMVLSHICSLMEAALLSITPSQLAELRQKNSKIGQVCQALKHDIDKPIAVILIVNTAAHTIGAAVAGGAVGATIGSQYMSVFTILFTLLMVQYTEILPKTLGVRFNQKVMRYAARPLQVLIWILMPLIRLTHFINRPFERRRPEKPSTADEISALAALARSSQVISTRQERIIRAVPRLSEQTASRVMLPVENISFLSSGQTVSDAISATGTDFHTRYPVCDEGDRDKVLGYVNFKELVATHRAHPGAQLLTDILRPIAFAEPDDTASELLERFASQHCHMTIVRDAVDGRTLGLVTLEDIVEELLGDLDDEFDPLPRTFYSPSEFFWVVGGGVPMTLLTRDTHLDLPRRAEPVAVWFARMLKRPPKVGDTIRHGNAEFYVRKIRRGQVWEFNLKRIKFEG
ncbi:MAG: HlyC/CorC family transporter [Lentisphaeria bacterium]|nr:HlyC/CorC family transporter [Lentisphaeria bacterium]